MIKKYLNTSVLAVIGLFASVASVSANSLDDNNVVRSTNGNVAYSLGSGKCVRTTLWEAGHDICAPVVEAPPAPVYVPAPQPVVHTILSAAEGVVFFEYDKYGLTPSSMQQLDKVASKLKNAMDVQSADIVGFADQSGAESYNQKLSEKRAESVRSYLAQRGYLNTQVVMVKGVGETQAQLTCSKGLPRKEYEACMLPDRKVELKLRYHEQVVTMPVPTAPVAPIYYTPQVQQ